MKIVRWWFAGLVFALWFSLMACGLTRADAICEFIRYNSRMRDLSEVLPFAVYPCRSDEKTADSWHAICSRAVSRWMGSADRNCLAKYSQELPVDSRDRAVSYDAYRSHNCQLKPLSSKEKQCRNLCNDKYDPCYIKCRGTPENMCQPCHESCIQNYYFCRVSCLQWSEKTQPE